MCEKHFHKSCRYDFCEAQTGKDACDRKIATLKGAISKFLKSQEDILTAHDIKKALDLNLSVNSGVRTYVCGVESSFDFKDTFKFPNVTNFHSFVYSKTGNDLTYFRHYNIGNGITKSVESFIVKSQTLQSVKQSFEKFHLNFMETDQENRKPSIQNKKAQKFQMIHCDKQGCGQIFFDERSFEKHTNYHNSTQNIPQISKTLITYVSLINQVRSNQIESNKTFKLINLNEIQSRNELKKGHALKKRKKSKLNPKNSMYLLEIFKKGINNSQKASPEGVKNEMIQLDDQFEIEERLSADEIKSFFSRMNAMFNTKKLDGFEKRLKVRFSEYTKRKMSDQTNQSDEYNLDDDFLDGADQDIIEHEQIELRRSQRKKYIQIIEEIEED